MALGEQIRMRLKKKGISQNELARKAGISSSGMSTIINGAYDPRLGNLQMIASALDCTVGDLLDEKEKDTPKDALIEQIMLTAQRLSPERRRQLEEYARFLERQK